MAKEYSEESVLHEWVHTLPFQMQALLLTGMRGPDNNSKHNPAKAIVRYLRGVICKPAGDWNGTNDNDFMWADYNKFTNHVIGFWEDHDEYPHHFIMHLVHCAQVVGYCHPIADIAGAWLDFYNEACESFHMMQETKEDMFKRLNDFGEGWHNK